MVITQIQHPSHPRIPTPLVPRQQGPALIDRRHTLIWWTKRPGPPTHTHHQQTPDPIINNTNGQGLPNDITGTADTHARINHSIITRVDSGITRCSIITPGITRVDSGITRCSIITPGITRVDGGIITCVDGGITRCGIIGAV